MRAACADFAGLEDLLDGGKQTVGVGQHDLVELRALGIGEFAALQSFQIEADGGDGGFELVGDGVEEGVLTLVAADLADQEDGVEDDACGEDAKEDDAEDKREDTSLVENDVTNVEVDRAADEEHPEGDGKGDGSASSVDVHGVLRTEVAWINDARCWAGSSNRRRGRGRRGSTEGRRRAPRRA